MYALFIFIFLSALPTIESSRCSKECKFKDFQLNSSLPSDFCSTSKSNNDIDQQCRVELSIDFTTGLVNGSLTPQTRWNLTDNTLDIRSFFSLNDTSVKVNILYYCSVSDYCDIDFVRETLSSNWSAIQVQPIREKLVSRLYNQNNTDPIKCFSNNSCLQNESFCFVVYSYFESFNDAGAVGTCRNMNKLPQVQWSQSYEANGVGKSLIELGSYYCNTPTCGYNSSAIETFQMLSHEYILPVNLSVINATTLPWPTETTPLTAMSTIGVTTSNGAPYILVDFFNTLMISFLITKYF